MILLLLFTVVVMYVLWKWSIMLTESRKTNIPGPMPLPIVEFLDHVKSLYERHGDIVRTHLLSDVFVICRKVEVIEAIVTSNEFGAKGALYNFIKPFLGEGLLTNNGPRWKHHRKLLTPAFHFNILQNFLPIFIKNQKILIDKLLSHDSKEPLDLFPIITLAALDNVTEAVMGVGVNAQINSDSAYVKNIEIASRIVSERQRNVFLSTDFIFYLSSLSKELKKAIDFLHNYTRMVIDARKKELASSKITQLEEQSDFGIKNRYAFLDLLLLAKVDGKPIPDEWVREEVDTFLFEGHDTTSSGIVFTLLCLAQNPEIQQKVYEEQKTIFNGDFSRDVTISDLNQMNYLGLVMKESLRLFPPVPFIERAIHKDVDIAGCRFLKNSALLIDIFHMHRNPKYFDEPLKFKPERFENEKGNNFSWLAFSAGTRNCIGQKFALLEMKTIITAIVRQFKLTAVDKPVKITPNLVLKSATGVHVMLEQRK